MKKGFDPFYDIFQNYGRHYASMEERGHSQRLPDDLKRLKRDRLPPWIDEIPKEACILDAGCAQGHLLEALRRLGYVQLTGVELSTQLLATARVRLSESVQLIEADIRDWLKQASPQSYDLVFFHDVLEHLPRKDTIEVLRSFHRLLAPGGLISVRVPNMSCLIAANCMAIDFTHITHFTELSLLQVLEAAGFDPVRISFERQAPRFFWSWRYSYRCLFRLLNRLRWYLNNGVHRGLYLLVDFLPPTVFDPNLIAVVQK